MEIRLTRKQATKIIISQSLLFFCKENACFLLLVLERGLFVCLFVCFFPTFCKTEFAWFHNHSIIVSILFLLKHFFGILQRTSFLLFKKKKIVSFYVFLNRMGNCCGKPDAVPELRGPQKVPEWGWLRRNHTQNSYRGGHKPSRRPLECAISRRLLRDIISVENAADPCRVCYTGKDTGPRIVQVRGNNISNMNHLLLTKEPSALSPNSSWFPSMRDHE